MSILHNYRARHAAHYKNTMVRLGVIAFLLLLLLGTCGANAAPCVNELLNGSYEEGDFGSSLTPDDWTNSAWLGTAEFTWDLDISYEGAASVKIYDRIANDAAWTQTINLTPNTNYLLSGWIKTDNVSTNGAGANLCLWGTWTRSETVNGTNDWTYTTLYFNSGPTGEVTIGARLGFWGGSSSGTAWFDHLKVTQLAPPAPAPDPDWDILVLIYDKTDFYFTDSGSLEHHVIAAMTPQEKADAAAQATAFVENDIPLLNSGYMTPSVTIRFPEDPLSQLSLIDVEKWWPAPGDVADDLDPAFDSVIVVWDPRGYDLTTSTPRDLNKYAGLTANTNIGQAYTTIYIQGAMNLAHRNIYKHEWGHSILIFYDAAGLSPLPTLNLDMFPPSGPYVHYPTGAPYIWVDETDANPIPNSIYHNTSGFTHDYYSGKTATADQPTRALGIPSSAWDVGGPVAINTLPTVSSITRANSSPTNATLVQFTVTFSTSVNCVGLSDFVPDSSGGLTGSSITNVTGSGYTYTVTVNTGTGEGAISIDLIDDDTIMDSYGNLLGGPGPNNGDFTSGEAYMIDRTPPVVTIGPPSLSATNTGPVTYTITYTGANTINLTNADINLIKSDSANAAVNVTNGNSATPTVTLSAITGDGTLAISIDPATTTDLAGNEDIGAGPSASFIVDNIPPTVSIGPPSSSDTNSGPITYSIIYSDANSIILTAGDITLNKTGSANAAIAVSNGTSATPTITLSVVTGDGSLGISIAPGTSSDLAGNQDTGAGPSSTFNVNNTPPVITVDPLTTSDSSPPLTGTINDPAASISISISGQVNPAINNGSTWLLPDGTLDTLPAGTYTVSATATDTACNIGTDSTSAELTIESAGPGSGGTVTISHDLDHIFEGDRLEFTAPAGGSDYQWKKDGVPLVDNAPRITGTTSQVMVIDPVMFSDSGLYTVVYENNITKNIVETTPIDIVIQPVVFMPQGGKWTSALLLLLLLGITHIKLKHYTVPDTQKHK